MLKTRKKSSNILLDAAAQNGLQLTKENKMALKACIADDIQLEHALDSIITNIQKRDLLTTERLVCLAKMGADKLLALNYAVDTLASCDLLDEVMVQKILSPEYDWVCTTLFKGNFDYSINKDLSEIVRASLSMDKTVKESPCNLITSEWLCRLFEELEEEEAKHVCQTNDPPGVWKARSASYEIQAANRFAVRLAGSLEAPGGHLTAERTEGVSAAVLTVARRTWINRPRWIHMIDTITSWLGYYGLLNERYLTRLCDPTTSEQVYQVLSSPLVGLVADRLPPGACTLDLVDELFRLAGERDASALGDVGAAYAAAVKAVEARIEAAREQFEEQQQVVAAIEHGPRIDFQGIHSPVFEQSVKRAMKSLYYSWGPQFNEIKRQKGKNHYWDEIKTVIQAAQDKAASNSERESWEKCFKTLDHVCSPIIATSSIEIEKDVYTALGDLVGMAWTLLCGDRQHQESFLISTFRDSAEAYDGPNGMTCIGGFRNRVILGLSGLIPADSDVKVDLVFETNDMATTRFLVLVREGILEYLEQKSKPKTAEDYRTLKAELDELMMPDSEIPKSIGQAIKDQVRQKMATQFPYLYADLQGKEHLGALFELLSSISISTINERSPTGEKTWDQLVKIQERLENSEGARRDAEHRATLKFPVLVLEALVQYFEENSAPQTADAYRMYKLELDRLLASDLRIPSHIYQEIAGHVEEKLATQFPQLYKDSPESRASDTLVDARALVSMINEGSLTGEETRDQLVKIQERLENSEGARLDADEAKKIRAISLSRQDFIAMALACNNEIQKVQKIGLPSSLQEKANWLVCVVDREVYRVENGADDGTPYQPSSELLNQQPDIEAAIRELSEVKFPKNLPDRSVFQTLLKQIINFFRMLFFCVRPDSNLNTDLENPEDPERIQQQDLVRSFARFFSCAPRCAQPFYGQDSGVPLSSSVRSC